MALQLFDDPPDLLPLVDVLELHRHRHLFLVAQGRAGDLDALVLRNALRGRPLVTELLRLASIGSAFLSAAADRPYATADKLKREFRAGDAELLVYLEGR